MGNQKKQKKAALGFSVISLSLIDRNSFNPRKVFNEEALEELALSIKGKGVIQPIVVRPVGNRYEIVCGERRGIRHYGKLAEKRCFSFGRGRSLFQVGIRRKI